MIVETVRAFAGAQSRGKCADIDPVMATVPPILRGCCRIVNLLIASGWRFVAPFGQLHLTKSTISPVGHLRSNDPSHQKRLMSNL